MSAPLPYVDWEIVQQRVAETLATSVSRLDARFAGICSQAAKDATSEIRRIFILKGYSVANIELWDDREYYTGRLATFFALGRAATFMALDLKAIEWLDPRKELTEAGALILDGAATAPASGESDLGGVGSGTIDAVTEVECDYRRRFG